MSYVIGMALRQEIEGDGGGVFRVVFFNHSKGWYVIRPLSNEFADRLAKHMIIACDNSNLKYNVELGWEVLLTDLNTSNKCYVNASSLVAKCISEASNGYHMFTTNFTTATARMMLSETRLFSPAFEFISETETPLKLGDILVTMTSGTMAIVIEWR